MTSKEVQKMIIDVENDIERFGGMIQFYYQLNILRSYKQDLERLEKLEKAIEILKNVIILPMENDISMVDNKGNNYYILRYIKKLLSEQEYDFLKEVLENDK